MNIKCPMWKSFIKITLFIESLVDKFDKKLVNKTHRWSNSLFLPIHSNLKLINQKMHIILMEKSDNYKSKS